VCASAAFASFYKRSSSIVKHLSDPACVHTLAGIKFKETRSPALQGHLKMAPHHQGIVVTAVNPTSTAAGAFN